MLPNQPLDVTGKQICVGDHVVFSTDKGSALIIAKVSNITYSFVCMESWNRRAWRRQFAKVAVLEKN